MKRLNFKLLTICLSAGLAFCSCSKNPEISTEEHPFIAAYTSGNVSVKAPIVIKFIDDIELKSTFSIGQKLDNKTLKIHPNIKGEVIWLGNNTIEFRHEKPFDSDKKYFVTVNVGAIAKLKGMPETFTYELNTVRLSFSYNVNSLSIYDDFQADTYYLTGSVFTSDFVDAENVKKILKIEPNLVVNWEHNNLSNTHDFRIDSIKSKDDEYEITLKFDGKPLDIKKSNTETVMVPKKDDFKIINVVVEYFPELTVIATFSAPLKEKQRFADYVTISDGSTLRFSVNINKLNIFPSGRKIGTHQMTFNRGILSRTGKKIEEDATYSMSFEDLKPAVKFLSKGVVLPSENMANLLFSSVNYAEVDVKVLRIFENNILQFLQENNLNEYSELYRVSKEVARTTIVLGDANSEKLKNWNTYSLDLTKLITPQPGAIYRVFINGLKPLKEEEYDYYSDWYFGAYGTFENRVRNILVSDLGITAKISDKGNITVFVTNLNTAQPESGVFIKVYDYTNQLLTEGSTNHTGTATLQTSENPWVIVASKGDQKGYLKVNSGGNLSLSGFDVSGSANSKGLKGFIYGERGVWRPGDDIYLSFILMDKNDILPKNHPVKLEFVNPLGQVVTSAVKTVSENGMYLFELRTDDDAPTGNWTANVSVGGETFSKTIKIETVKPNKLKINFTLNDNPYLKSDISGRVESMWLHGATASNLKVEIDLMLTKTKTTFEGYDNYVFDDITTEFYTEEEEFYSGKLDEKGHLEFKESLYNEDSPGMLRANFTVRVFEPSGDFSIDQYSTLFAPYETFVGLQTPKETGYYNMIETNRQHEFQVVTINDAGKLTNATNLDINIYRMEWNWWWFSSNSDLASYNQSSYNRPVYSAKVSTTNGKGTFNYKWDNEDWGLYLIKVSDRKGGHSVSKVVYVDWGYSNRMSESGGDKATMLVFKSDKTKYNVGEKAVIIFPSSKEARALISIETGSKIINSFWTNCENSQTKIEIPIENTMTPNIYCHISLIQPHSQTKNDAPIRLYGVIPIFVEDPNTRLTPVISMPNELKPQTEFTVKISEQNGNAMGYTIAIVDEGLLDLTRFKTPNPWSLFFAREALGIRTWDMYDYVIGAYGGKIEQLFAIGGDAELSGKSSSPKAQRFRPVVKFLGPFTLKKGATDQHKITLPPYIGSVRTMVVASTGKAFGNAEKTTPVRKPLMLSITLPRVIGTDEEFLLPVTVFAMDDKVKNVTVKINEFDNFEVSGSKSHSLKFDKIDDKMVYFKLKASEIEAIGKITVVASTSDDTASETLEISIRNPNPFTTTSFIEVVEAGKTYTGKLELFGIKGTNAASVEVSSLPPLNMSERLRFLIKYPHGCLEQTTSGAFPQLYLSKVSELDKSASDKTERNVKAAIERLIKFQTYDGGFAYWQGERYVNTWTTNYAGHFLLEAERCGYAVPSTMKNKWVEYQTTTARNWKSSTSSDIEQAYRLYVLALAKHPERGAMNRLLEQKDKISNRACWFLAGAFALDSKTAITRRIISEMPQKEKSKNSSFSDDFGSDERDMAVSLSVLTTLGDNKEAFLIVKQISEILNSDKWLSTQSTAWSLMAISKYIELNADNESLSYNFTIGDNKKSVNTRKSVSEDALNVANNKGSIPVNFKNTGNNTLYVKFVMSGIAEKGKEVAKSNNLKIEVKYQTANRVPINVSEIAAGTDFEAVVTVTNPGRLGTYTNLALSQIFPSGWEIRNDRLNFDHSRNDGIRYQEIRDDRVYSYFDLKPGESKQITTRLTATYQGKFYLPAQICEAMYDNSVNAATEGKWCEVVR